MKKLSTQYHANLKDYQISKEEPQDTNTSVSTVTEQTFEKEGFNLCQIVGNFGKAFIVCSFNQKLYLIDQHAASEKCLYMRFIEQKNLLPEIYKGEPFSIENIYREVLEQQKQLLAGLGWNYQILAKGPVFTTVKLTSSPSIFDRKCKQVQFLEVVQQYYEKSIQEVSKSQKQSMATVACHNAYRIGDKLQKQQMRALVDTLYKMSGSFNCPHGRPIVVCLGMNSSFKQEIQMRRQYSLL